MLRDIVEQTYCNAKVILRVFDMDKYPKYKDITVTLDNVDEYEGAFTISCIVPRDNELLIEGTM